MQEIMMINKLKILLMLKLFEIKCDVRILVNIGVYIFVLNDG